MEITRQEMNEFWAQGQARAREAQGHLLASQQTVADTTTKRGLLSSAAAIRTFYEIQHERMTAAMGIPKECALGCNARTYNPICNVHAPNPPIRTTPEPAPELCAYPGCPNGVAAKHCTSTTCDKRSRGCHDFVAPQAKPVIAKPADIYAGPPITGTAKPVLREPKPRADGYPDVCLECRGEKGDGLYYCSSCFRIDGLRTFYDRKATWDALRRSPAAKDIPSPVADTPTLGVEHKAAKSTEAARGGEAAITKRICKRHGCTTEARPALNYCGPWCASWPNPPSFERGPSATAHAPAAPGIEPWRPSVDDWDLLPDAETGWRR